MTNTNQISFPQSITIDTLANTCGGFKVGDAVHYRAGGGKVTALHVDLRARALYVEKDTQWNGAGDHKGKYLFVAIPDGASFVCDELPQAPQGRPAKG